MILMSWQCINFFGFKFICRGGCLKNLANELSTAVNIDKTVEHTPITITRPHHTCDKDLFARTKWSQNPRYRAPLCRTWHTNYIFCLATTAFEGAGCTRYYYTGTVVIFDLKLC